MQLVTSWEVAREGKIGKSREKEGRVGNKRVEAGETGSDTGTMVCAHLLDKAADVSNVHTNLQLTIW